jgi:hypothetical protein
MTSEIKSSGNHHTIKVTHGLHNSISSIRKHPISPMKGTRNPSHIQIKNLFKKGR